MNDDVLALLDWYQPLAQRTANPNAPVRYYQIGFLSELGELCGLYKKAQWHGKVIPNSEWISELGDCIWYGTMLLWTYASQDTRDAQRVTVWESIGRLVQQRVTVHSCSGGGIDCIVMKWWRGPYDLEDIEYVAHLVGSVLALCSQYGGIESVMQTNIEKLKARYPNGFVIYSQRSDNGVTP